MVKASACIAGDPGSIPGSGRSPEEGNSFPLQYSCLENFIDRGAWRAIQSMGSRRVRHDWATDRHIVDLQCYAYSAAQWSGSLIYTFKIYILHYGLPQDIEYSSLCYTVGLCLWYAF